MALRGKIGLRQAWVEILLVLALVGFSGLAVAELAGALMGRLPLSVLLVLQGMLIIAGLTMLLEHAEQRWRDVGLQPIRASDVGRGLVLLAVCMGANLILMLILQVGVPDYAREHMEGLQDIASKLAGDLPVAGIAATMFFVGVYEEMTARGFLLARCLTVLDGVWAPVLLSAILFGLGHVYQGWIGVAQTAVMGAILAVYTVRWGTLWPAIIAHALLNTAAVAALEGRDAWESVLILQRW